MTVDSRNPVDADGRAIDGVDDGVPVNGPDVDDDGYTLDDEGQFDHRPEGGDPSFAVWEDRLVVAPDDVGDRGVAAAPLPGALSRRHVVGSVLLARLAAGGLWLLVIAAVVMAAVALVVRSSQGGPQRAAVDAAAVPAADEAVLVSGFAQMALRRYLGEAGEETEEVMAPFLGGVTRELDGVTPQGFFVLDTVTVDVDERGDGYWSATVAADLMAAVEEEYQPIGLRYYDVGVVIGDGQGGGPALADLPSQVAAPELPEPPELLSGSLSSPDDSPQVAAVHEFLSALLLGEGSIQRYVTPGTDISAVDPPPFVSLEIDEFAVADPEADQTVARASVLAVDGQGLAQRLNYTVDLRLRDGRWEVAELFDAPPLAEQ